MSSSPTRSSADLLSSASVLDEIEGLGGEIDAGKNLGGGIHAGKNLRVEGRVWMFTCSNMHLKPSNCEITYTYPQRIDSQSL